MSKLQPKKSKQKQSENKRFIITAAQNATPVHSGFFEALKVAAEDMNAELIVVPLRYKNPTSRWTESQENQEAWSDELLPYLVNVRKKLCDNLVLAGDIKTQLTASSPLTGFEGLTHAESCILGHSKVQLRVIPVPSGKLPKILTTTGVCTLPNYTDSKAGKLGAFHHSFAAVVVEVYGRRFHLRQISANKDGSFIDLDKVYSPKGINKALPALGLSLGDLHCDFVDPAVVKATFGSGGIVEVLKPRHIFWHDLCDGVSHNPHEKNNIFAEIAKRSTDKHKIRAEVERACLFVENNTPQYSKSIIVGSNHSDFLRRWILNSDWREDGDPDNAEFYLETALNIVKETKMQKNGVSYPSPFAQWAKKMIKNIQVEVLDKDESFMLSGVEYGLHGHEGPNGARGSAKNLSKLGTKVVIGHSHTPCIEGGCFQAGTSSYLRLGYNSGPSSWLNSHVVQYSNGKRCIITVIDGQWRV